MDYAQAIEMKKREEADVKWTNRGHELDAAAERYLKVKTLYIWGTGVNGTDCISFLEWLKIDKDFTIYFVNSTPEKQGILYHGHLVLSPEELFAQYNAESVVASSNAEISGILEEHGIPYFDLAVSNHGKHLFIQHFLCVYLLYKYGRLLSHWTDFNPTTACNLNCEGCLNFNNEIQKPVNESLSSFQQHMDTFFQKIDICYSFHFSGGEPFLSKELPAMLRYLATTYGARIYDKFVITNGTILPSEELLEALEAGGYWVFFDDYRDTVPLARERIPQIEDMLRSHSIQYTINRADIWFNLAYGTERYRASDELALMKHRDGCNTYLQNCSGGRFYSCCWEAFAYKAGVVDHADFLDIQRTSKKEILEYRLGYTELGYVDMCRQCLGIGEDTRYIKPAVQIPHKYKQSQL